VWRTCPLAREMRRARATSDVPTLLFRHVHFVDFTCAPSAPSFCGFLPVWSLSETSEYLHPCSQDESTVVASTSSHYHRVVRGRCLDRGTCEYRCARYSSPQLLHFSFAWYFCRCYHRRGNACAPCPQERYVHSFKSWLLTCFFFLAVSCPFMHWFFVAPSSS